MTVRRNDICVVKLIENRELPTFARKAHLRKKTTPRMLFYHRSFWFCNADFSSIVYFRFHYLVPRPRLSGPSFKIIKRHILRIKRIKGCSFFTIFVLLAFQIFIFQWDSWCWVIICSGWPKQCRVSFKEFLISINLYSGMSYSTPKPVYILLSPNFANSSKIHNVYKLGFTAAVNFILG